MSAPSRPSDIEPPETERAWDSFCEQVEISSRRELDSADDFDSAYIAFRNGVTASDYALEVVVRAAETAVA